MENKNLKADPAASDARLSQIRERHEQDAAEYPFALSARIIAGGRCSQLHADVGWLLARLDTRERQVKSVLLSVRTTANQNYKIKAYGVAEALHYVADQLEKMLK